MQGVMSKKQKKMLTRIMAAAFGVILLNFVPVTGILRFTLYLAVYLVIGYDILKKAGRGILNRRMFDENFLMAVATIGAFALAVYSKSGDYNEAIAVMLFYQIGELFQSYAVGKSRRNISALMDIRPDYANVECDGKLEKRELKAGELFEKAEVMARYRLSQKKIRLKKEIHPENLLIFGDEDLLISFLLNLIDNGCKASEEGKILILRAEERRIGVQDFGRGIPEEELERITEPFYMVDKSRARREGGAGLGLALCRQIAEVHGGQLKIRSREGAGTFVWLEWPGTVTTSLQTGEDLLTEKGV